MTFNSDTTGTVTAPDGIPVPFTLPPSLPAQFANPLDICFGEVANSAGGYGQYFDIGKIAITNVAGGGVNEIDDFTQDSSFNTNLWSAAFSVTSTNAVVEVTTNTPYWVNWTVPAINFGLETKGLLTDPTWVFADLLEWHTAADSPKPNGTQLNLDFGSQIVSAHCGRRGGRDAIASGILPVAKSADIAMMGGVRLL